MLDWIGDLVEAVTEELADYKEHRKARAAKREKPKRESYPTDNAPKKAVKIGPTIEEQDMMELKGGRSQRQIKGVDPYVGVQTSTGAIYYYESPANCLRVITLAPFTDVVVPYRNLELLDNRRASRRGVEKMTDDQPS